MWNMHQALECIMQAPPTTSTLGDAPDSVNQNASMAHLLKTSSIHALMMEAIVGNIVLTCARSGMPMKALSITTQRRVDHEKQAGHAGSRPQIVSSKSLYLNSLLQAKSSPRLHRGRTQSRLSPLTKVRTAPVTRRHHRIHRRQAKLKASSDLCQRLSQHLRQCQISLVTSLLQMAVTFLRQTLSAHLVDLLLNAAETDLMKIACQPVIIVT